MSNSTLRFYAVIANENPNGSHHLRRFTNREEANNNARATKGQLFEYMDRPLEEGEDHRIRGRLIEDYSE